LPQPTHKLCSTCGSLALETCRQCGRKTFCDSCGLCIHHGEPRQRTAPTRQWIVRVRWLLRRRGAWTPWASTRVTARGPLGALTRGHRALRAHRPKRRHVVQTAIELVPVPTGGRTL
jgi:hypothetical protein